MASSRHTEETSRGLEEELLQLLGRQGRRMPLPVFMAAAMIAWLARDSPHTPDAHLGLWLLLVVVVLAVRKVVLGRLPQMASVPAARRLATAVALSALNGCTHALALAAFPAPTDFQLSIRRLSCHDGRLPPGFSGLPDSCHRCAGHPLGYRFRRRRCRDRCDYRHIRRRACLAGCRLVPAISGFV